jgi:tetratricopeptide (TPR) repeat protein
MPEIFTRMWVAASAVGLLTSCSGQIHTPVSGLSGGGIDARLRNDPAAPQLLPDTTDGEKDAALSEGCVEAWRKALKGDEAGAMKQLQELDKRYPQAVTVKFMMGQVADHSGKKKQAAEYYRQAVGKSRFNSMYLFKLAESLRTAGNVKEAAPRYRELIALNPDFVPARVGLAECLWKSDKTSQEARQQVQKALELDPKNQKALELSQELRLVVK